MKSVGELIREGKEPTKHYLIPDYQRGYRWQAKEQVLALLEDVKGFMDSKPSGEEIYCLQPVVVTPHVQELDRRWEVIDGQQRLTTLYLLLHALQSKECYTISFPARPESTSFLQRLVLSGQVMDEQKTPDYYFMSEAYKFIHTWLENMEGERYGFTLEFTLTLLKRVQVIWYEVETSTEGEKIEIFNRLNIGKIPLDDAELIRALFLNQIGSAEAAKAKQEEHQKKDREDTHEVILRRGIFASEWLEIEYYLRNPSIWGFLFPKESPSEAPANRILRLFKLVAEAKSDQGRATFRYFEQEIQGKGTAVERETEVERFWSETKEVFAFLRSCYTDRKLYHKLGLALSLGIVRLQEALEKRKEDKDAFKYWLTKKIQEHFGEIVWEDLSYDKSYNEVLQVLLLFNVLTLDQMADTQEHRFPFDRYHAEKWSVEHIHPQSIEGLTKIRDPKRWIESALDSLQGIKDLPKLQENSRPFGDIIEELRRLLEKEIIDRPLFLNLAEELEKYFSDQPSSSSDQSPIHSLGNLALLSFGNNAALNNSYFPTKRKRLLDLETQGCFVPMCTRNVFLKTYSPPNTFPYRWTKEDKYAYLEAMKKTLAGYILFPTPEPQQA